MALKTIRCTSRGPTGLWATENLLPTVSCADSLAAGPSPKAPRLTVQVVRLLMLKHRPEGPACWGYSQGQPHVLRLLLSGWAPFVFNSSLCPQGADFTLQPAGAILFFFLFLEGCYLHALPLPHSTAPVSPGGELLHRSGVPDCAVTAKETPLGACSGGQGTSLLGPVGL